MNLSTEVFKSEHLGIKDLKLSLNKVKLSKWFIATSANKPISVNVPYNDFLELMEFIDDLKDDDLVSRIKEGREAITKKSKGFASSYLQ